MVEISIDQEEILFQRDTERWNKDELARRERERERGMKREGKGLTSGLFSTSHVVSGRIRDELVVDTQETDRDSSADPQVRGH